MSQLTGSTCERTGRVLHLSRYATSHSISSWPHSRKSAAVVGSVAAGLGAAALPLARTPLARLPALAPALALARDRVAATPTPTPARNRPAPHATSPIVLWSVVAMVDRG